MKLITCSFSNEKKIERQNKIIAWNNVVNTPVTSFTAKDPRLVAYDVPAEIICDILSKILFCNVLANAHE